MELVGPSLIREGEWLLQENITGELKEEQAQQAASKFSDNTPVALQKVSQLEMRSSQQQRKTAVQQMENAGDSNPQGTSRDKASHAVIPPAIS